jgi:hypothetical protein
MFYKRENWWSSIYNWVNNRQANWYKLELSVFFFLKKKRELILNNEIKIENKSKKINFQTYDSGY